MTFTTQEKCQLNMHIPNISTNIAMLLTENEISVHLLKSSELMCTYLRLGYLYSIIDIIYNIHVYVSHTKCIYTCSIRNTCPCYNIL